MPPAQIIAEKTEELGKRFPSAPKSQIRSILERYGIGIVVGCLICDPSGCFN